MSDLTDFLLARIAEDEAAREAGLSATYVPSSESDKWHWVKRSKAECEAKRRIVEFHRAKHERERAGGFACFTAKALALPYADHPDWREEWKP